MIPQFNSIILDVVVVVLLLTIIAIGAFKGIKHIAINFGLFLVSLALSLTPLTNIIKNTIINLFFHKIELGAGVGDEIKIGVSMSYRLIAALILTLLLYVILRLIKLIIVMMYKRRKLKSNQLISPPRRVSRVTGAIFSFFFNGIMFIFLLSLFALPMVGGNKTLNSSYIAKHIERSDDFIIELVTDDTDLVKEKILVKVLNADILLKVNQQDAEAMKNIYELVESGKFMPEDLSEPQKQVDYLYSVLMYVEKFALDENGLEIDGFEKFVERTRDAVEKSVNQINTLHGKQSPIDAKNTLAVANLIKKIGLEKTAIIFESIFVMK